ncbi:MAG: toll/interleukin-1 receptor domain-containing protein, partial [Chloroflexota bacterium]
MARIFISYARKDGAEAANELTNRLYALRHQVFMDVHGIPGGVKWEEELIERAAWCDVMLVIVTPASNESKYVYHEVREAEKNNKLIVPIRIGDVSLPNHLRSYNAYKLVND